MSTADEITSLESQLASVSDEAQQLILLRELVSTIFVFDLNKCLIYAEELLSLSRKLNHMASESLALCRMGYVRLVLGDYPEAISCLEAAQITSDAVGETTVQILSLNFIAQYHQLLGNFAVAVEFYQRALAVSEKENDVRLQATTLNNLGGLYTFLNEFDLGNDFQKRALSLHEKMNNQYGVSVTVGNMGLNYFYHKNYEKARQCYEESLAIQVELNDKRGEIQSRANIGIVYEKVGEIEIALKHFLQALMMARSNGLKFQEAEISLYIGRLYAAEKPQIV